MANTPAPQQIPDYWLSQMTPKLAILAERFWEACSREGIQMRMLEVLRSDAQHAALQKANRIQARRKSSHQAGPDGLARAFDAVPQILGGRKGWDRGNPLWNRIGVIAHECGLAWGGHWSASELQHFQITDFDRGACGRARSTV